MKRIRTHQPRIAPECLRHEDISVYPRDPAAVHVKAMYVEKARSSASRGSTVPLARARCWMPVTACPPARAQPSTARSAGQSSGDLEEQSFQN